MKNRKKISKWKAKAEQTMFSAVESADSPLLSGFGVGRSGGRFEKWRLHRRGVRDGRGGLPRPNGEGLWCSPETEKLRSTFGEATECIWEQAERATAALHAEAAMLAGEITRMRARLEDFDVHSRRGGEENLDSSVVETRRRGELQPLEQAELRLRIVLTHIGIIESIARLSCEAARCETALRLAAYWSGAAESHPDKASLPPAPPPLRTDAEKTYMSRYSPGLCPEAAVLERKGEFLCPNT